MSTVYTKETKPTLIICYPLTWDTATDSWDSYTTETWDDNSVCVDVYTKETKPTTEYTKTTGVAASYTKETKP